MTDIRQIRSISNYSGGGKGSGGYSGGQSQQNSQHNRWSNQSTYDNSSLNGPIIPPPISFYDIPVIKV